MLIGRAPLRISFGGGGTDLEAYYGVHRGFILSATIDKYVYGIVTPGGSDTSQVISADYQSVLHYGGVQSGSGELNLARAVLDEFPMTTPVNVFMASEVPPGTGLGSSGSVAVNLINILNTICETGMDRARFAELAYHVEVEKLGAPVGKQDQYAAAFGGINAFWFGPDGARVERLPISAETLARFEDSLMLFFTGNSRSAWEILHRQQRATQTGDAPVIDALHRIKELGMEMRRALLNDDPDEVGHLMHESWLLKKRLAPNVSSGGIDAAYEAARECGVFGGKIAGAGGGGFLLVYCPASARAAVRERLAGLGMVELHFGLEFGGARIVLNAGTFLPQVARGDGNGRNQGLLSRDGTGITHNANGVHQRGDQHAG